MRENYTRAGSQRKNYSRTNSIIEYLKEGKTYKDVSHIWGVSPQRISDIALKHGVRKNNSKFGLATFVKKR